MICKRCGAELEDGARFCSSCGALQPIICPECGAESRPGSRVCSNCGKKLPVPVHEEPLVDYPKRKKNTSTKIAITAIVIGALLLLLGALFALKDTLLGVKEGGEDHAVPPAQTEELEKPDPKPVPDLTPDEKPDPVPAVKPDEEAEPAPEEQKPDEEPQPEEEPEEEQAPAEDPKPEEEQPPEEAQKPEPEPQPEPEPEPQPEFQKQGEWYFPDSNERLLTQADIAGMSSQEINRAKNEIYARRGRRFKNQELQAYFDSCSWYEGTIAPENFDDNSLNEVERANAAFLKAAE